MPRQIRHDALSELSRLGIGPMLLALHLIWLGGCSQSSAPTLIQSASPLETAALIDTASSAVPLETAIVVEGTPTEVYALVARGALGCWLGANGPLKATHVFHADAAPPSQGGAAEIVLHERDETLRDRRGARAMGIKFTGDASGVRVGVSVIKIAPPLAELMVRDVEVWARRGEGCLSAGASRPQPRQSQQPATISARRGSR